MDETRPQTERLIRLADVPSLAWLPARRNGARLGLSTVHRWAATGIRGHRLRTVRVGAALSTTEAWLMEFFEQLAGDGSAPVIASHAKRKQEIRRAERALEEAGI